MIQNRSNRLDKLSGRQDRPLRNGFICNVLLKDWRDLPKFESGVLSLGPMQPVRNKFNEVQLFADVGKFSLDLRQNKTEVEKICEIDLSR